ncbi:MAG: hypothetical protein OEW08_10865 [Gammaproteobacteria bacterium]|nr:hypothetical protein [Gammaproteobacteria bacterium]
MHTVKVIKVTQFAIASVALIMIVAQPIARAELPAPMHAKVEHYKKKLTTWAADPVVVKAAKEANAKEGGLEPGMTNSKWDELADQDVKVTQFQTSAAGKLLTNLEKDKGISKLYLRDAKGNLVASSANKPLIFNVSTKPAFINGIKGAWAAGEIKPDPTTQVKGVNMAVPVLDGGKVIGILQSSVVAE